jgi:phospholipid/cholesterol/gamma-HCH transport system substrate-binding protein
MASQRTKFTVGLFLTFGIGIALLAFIWLGMSRFLQKGHYYATYFNESVQGLDVDSPVKYRGVSIGRVDSIEVAPDARLIEVILKIDTGQKLDNDIVAQLSPVGITGGMIIELDRMKEGEPDQSPELGFQSEYPVVSSKPSEISGILQGINDVLIQIRSMDLEVISGKIKLALDNANQAILDTDLKTLSKSLESSLEDLRRIVDREKWDRIMASLEDAVSSFNSVMDKADTSLGHVEGTVAGLERITVGKAETIEAAIEDFKAAAEKANTLLEKGHSLVDGTDDLLSNLRQYLLDISRNLEQASENINRITETIADQPSQLIFGEPPVPREVEGE